MELFILMGIDSNAVRTYHVFSLLEKSINDQRKSTLDFVFGLLGGFVAVFDYLTFLQVPTTAPYVLVISGALLAVAGFIWWTRRGRGYESLARVRKFGLYLDQMRRSSRQLDIAELLSSPGMDLAATKAAIRRSLRTAVEGVDAIIGSVQEIDYYTLGEDKADIAIETASARKRLQ